VDVERVPYGVRIVAIVVAALVACAFAVEQVLASVALREHAQAPAWMRALPATIDARVDRIGPSAPLPATLRLVLARRALERGDLANARASVAVMRPSRDRFALEAELASRAGDRDGAVRAYLAAGDLAGVEAAVKRLEAAGRIVDAVALQEAVVARLASDPTQRDALAEADYGLGEVRETRAYTIPPRAPERRGAELRALDAYASAAKLAPLSVRYLVAVGNQRINVGDFARARGAFERARDIDPTSAEPWTGLGDLAFREGARDRAEAMLERARALAPQSDAVRRLSIELHS